MRLIIRDSVIHLMRYQNGSNLNILYRNIKFVKYDYKPPK